MTTPDPPADRLAIAEALYDYAEAMDLIGASPVPAGADDPGLRRAMPILARWRRGRTAAAVPGRSA
jgi:hypothetical protein